jgi:glycosyltransferase involved in cell wall biosynthesis
MTHAVSVVIPAYKAASTICRAVDSVRSQTHPPVEILVVDDGGFDAEELSLALRPYGDQVTLIRQPHGGVASARNRGASSARGDWVAYLDSDDYWEPTKLQRQVAVLDTHPNVAMIGCRYWDECPGEARREAGSARFTGRLLELSGREIWDAAMTIWTGTVVIRRAVLTSLKFRSVFEPAEDRDMWVRLLAAHSAYCLPDFLATYIQYPSSLSNASPERDCNSMLAVVRTHSDILGPKMTREQEAIIHRRLCGSLLARGECRKAFRPAIRRLQVQPFSFEAWSILAKVLALGAIARRSPEQ